MVTDELLSGLGASCAEATASRRKQATMEKVKRRRIFITTSGVCLGKMLSRSARSESSVGVKQSQNKVKTNAKGGGRGRPPHRQARP